MSFASRDAFPARGGVGDERPVPGAGRVPGTGSGTAPYVELHAHSAYSFLDGASLPEELAARAAELGYDALALTDHDGVYGSLEFAHAAKHFGVRPITGAEVTLAGGPPTSRCSARRSRATRTSAGSSPTRTRARACPGRSATCCRPRRRSRSSNATRRGSSPLRLRAPRSRRRRPERGRSGSRARSPARSTSSCSARTSAATRAATRGSTSSPSTLGVPTVATGDVHAHHPSARTAAGRARRDQAPHLARRLRARAAREPRGSPALAGRRCSSGCRADARPRTRELADRCAFDLTQELGYRYPDFSDGVDPADVQLRAICERAFAERYARCERPQATRAANGSTTSSR